ncbi:MAG: addiction module protein [bacterium]
MSFSLHLDEMTVADKLSVMELIWDDLCRNPAALSSPAWHGSTLDEREKRVQQGEETTSDWEEAKQRIRESLT